MKKGLAIALLLLVLPLSACGKKPPAETLPVETVPVTTVPAETEPELEFVIAEVNGIPAVLQTLSRGDSVDIVEAFDERHYAVKLETGYGLVEKNLVRLENKPAFEAWTGYTYHNAELFDNYRLAGAAKQLPSNTKVEVLEDLGWCMLVSYDGVSGYMIPEHLAKNPLGSSGNSGGSRKEDASSGSENTGADGGEIWLRSSAKLMLLSTIAPQEGSASRKATVLADETEVVLGYFDRGDMIPVLKEENRGETLTVYLEGLYASISGACVRAEDAESCEAWEGRSKYGAALYDDIWMLGSPADRLNTNTPVTVLYELENCYLVEAGDVMGYMLKEMILPVKAEPNAAGTDNEAPAGDDNSEPRPTQPEVPAPEASTPKPESGNSGTTDQKPEESKPESEHKPDDGTAGDPGENPSETPDESTGGNSGDNSESSSGDDSGNHSGNPSPEWTPPIL